MKKLYALIGLCLLTRIASATEVLNPGFESWTSGNPDDWYTNNVAGFGTPVTQVSPGSSGSFAAKGEVISLSGSNFSPIIVSGVNGAGTPVTQDYTNVSFYLKTNLTPGDILYVSVSLTDAGGNGVAYAEASITTTYAGFTLMNFPITYVASGASRATIEFLLGNPDSSGVASLGSYFIVDDVDLNFSTGVSEINSLSGLTIYPVPASDMITVNMKNGALNNTELIITGETGQIVLKEKFDGGDVLNSRNISTASLAPGFYTATFQNDEAVITKRLIIAR